ncbi:unnamed protein product [Spirodela intermedia]|uniref:Uncharacterized protein n=2 Tax=Spirodela intermedia TaxID=51605 RepID=A0A7I8J320_SPIIN|nr:unnamed protein product [Spirodela intermedia]CAA6663801.1 unnamed protein product [Spirodela intermedia]CAA7400299.1 unnamed protein product [Spirodela intermedia]
MARGVAGLDFSARSLMGSSVLSSGSAVVIIAERMAAGLHWGCTALSSAATPAAWGQAMEEPERMLKGLNRARELTTVAKTFSGQEARTSEPGATRSGFRTPWQLSPGPLEV